MNSYTIASYTQAAEFIGKGQWNLGQLSEKWLNICEAILEQHGPFFTHNMGGTLSHLEIRFTAGIGNFCVNDRSAFFIACLPGADEDQDREVINAFIEEYRDSETARMLSTDIDAFYFSIASHEERPLCISLIWGDPQINQKHYDEIMELGIHFAAAYLCRYQEYGGHA